MPSSLREALFLFLLMRISLSVFALAASFMFQLPPPCFHNGVVDWTSMPVLYSDGIEGRLLGVWQRWDACWYLRIATYGYEPGEPATAFFPLYPLSVRALGPLFGGNLVITALAVSAVGFVVAMTILHAMVTADLDRDTADRSILYLAIFPTAFFFFAPFTESVFLAAALASIYCMRTQRYAGAVVAALLAGLTRPQGVLLAIPLAWEAFLVVRAHRLAPGFRQATTTAVGAVVAAPLGFFLFVLAGSAVTGVSPLDAEKQHWGYANGMPWDVLGNAWRWMTDPANSAFANIQALTGFHLLLIFTFVVLFLVGLRRLPATYSLYVAPQLLLIMTGSPATPLESASRFMLAMFPIFAIMGLLGRRRWVHTSWLVASVLGLGLLLVAFLQNAPVG
ncbi:MAG: hypothetical protein HY262_03480 [Chloroflexi bacterium]|nr:hypothetical protein [Chloroflexota bacterium]